MVNFMIFKMQFFKQKKKKAEKTNYYSSKRLLAGQRANDEKRTPRLDNCRAVSFSFNEVFNFNEDRKRKTS